MAWVFTRHARERMREMGITEDQVLAVLKEPETRYDRKDSVIYQAGDLAVAVINDRVKTVLPRTQEKYYR